MINRVTIVGNVGKDPEIRATQSGDKVANFSVGTSERWTDKETGEIKEKTEWHRIVVWGSPVAIVEKMIQKGTLVYVEGKLETRKWQDRDGTDRYTTEIQVKFGGVIRTLARGKERGEASGERQKAPAGAGPQYDPELDDNIPF